MRLPGQHALVVGDVLRGQQHQARPTRSCCARSDGVRPGTAHELRESLLPLLELPVIKF